MRMRVQAVAPLLFSSILLWSACGKKSSSPASSEPGPGADQPPAGDPQNPGNVNLETDAVTGLENVTAAALTVPELLPPVAANTPGALAITLSASLTSFAIDCADSYATCAPGADQKACTFIADVKCRFFADAGPTQIKRILSNIDEGVASYEKTSKDRYVPCLDAVGNKDGLTVKQGDKTTEIAPYQAVAFDTKFADLKDKNGADKLLDLGFTYKLNCLAYSDDAKAGWTALGIDKTEAGKKFYALSTMGGKDGDRNGSVATIDEDDNVEYWGIVSQSGKTSTADLNMSNALIHLKSSATSQTIELSFAGKNVGPDCGMRMITNKTYALAEANMNAVGSCEADDVGHDATSAAMTFCLKVDESNPAAVDEVDCTTAGLTTASFSRAAIASTDVLPYEIAKLFPAPAGVPPFQTFELPKKD